ncbi:uncharacterized protein EDB91DRAFT_1081881 [Suillus paluster]|uniref:uncharacterized protein n=1 Tax=Suillus paluster TaxID=48578 RepID=UPI001B87CB2A|nr:uncharacterized protein EDB91DRAFT_1081881 [Suillus paluster]KAG1740801.1 hypothetical protein EDB91DRAFT_1081881 [Suillus paluster]
MKTKLERAIAELRLHYLMVVLDMLRAYLEHDAHLRAGTAAERATLAGYGDFALSFNMMQTTNSLPSRFAEESVTELLEEAVWMNLETTKRQREWRDRSIAERKAAKRARHTISAPSSSDRGEGSSLIRGNTHPNRENTPQTHSSSTISSTRSLTHTRMEVDDEPEPNPVDGKSAGDAARKEATRPKKK